MTSTNPSGTSGPMHRLGRDEIQAIMSFLDPPALIHFSGCNHQLYDDCDSAVVWKSRPIYEFDLTSFFEDPDQFLTDMKSASCSLFMRHQPGFSLIGHFTSARGTGQPFLEGLLETIPRIKRLTFLPDTDLSEGEWGSFSDYIENHGLSVGLEEFHLCCPFYGCLLSELVAWILRAMPNLQALTLPTLMYGPSYDCCTVELGQLPFLTSLALSEGYFQSNEATSIAPAVMKCDHLTRIEMNDTVMQAAEFHRVFTSPNLAAQLKELEIDHWYWFDKNIVNDDRNPITLNLLRATWKHLNQLERLTLSQVKRIDSFLPTLTSFNAKLQRLELTLLPYGSPASMIAPQLLQDLLNDLPSLVVELTVAIDQASNYDQLRADNATRFKCHPS